MTIEVTIFDPTEGHSHTHAFTHSPIRIGRAPDSDLHLDYPFVSTRHALLHVDGDRLDFVDLGSRNGTHRGGRPLPPHQPVTVDERLVVTIGRVELTIQRAHVARPSAPGEVSDELARVHELLRALRPLHDDALRAHTLLREAARVGLAGLSPRARELAEVMIARELPALAPGRSP